jgi:hypothetical protein
LQRPCSLQRNTSLRVQLDTTLSASAAQLGQVLWCQLSPAVPRYEFRRVCGPCNQYIEQSQSRTACRHVLNVTCSSACNQTHYSTRFRENVDSHSRIRTNASRSDTNNMQHGGDGRLHEALTRSDSTRRPNYSTSFAIVLLNMRAACSWYSCSTTAGSFVLLCYAAALVLSVPPEKEVSFTARNA